MTVTRALGLLVAVAVVGCCAGHNASARERTDAKSETATRQVAAEASFNGQTFAVTRRLLRSQPHHDVFALEFPSPVTSEIAANNVVPGEYYRPRNVAEGQPPRPAVVCLHILNGNFEAVRILCSALADRGVPAMMFKLPYYGERAPPGGRRTLLRDAKLFSMALDQAMSDIRRSVDVLSTMPEVDAEKIGVCGVSLGAILGATACDREPRLSRAMLILGGGDLKHIILTSREARKMRAYLDSVSKAERDKLLGRIDEFDPLNHASALAKLGERDALLMVNAADDAVVPRACAEKLATATGVADRVVWLDGLGHYTAIASLPRILDLTTDFFARDLPPGDWAAAESPGAASPADVFGAILHDLVTVLGAPVEEGRGHILEYDMNLTGEGLGAYKGRARFLRGAGGRFALDVTVPKFGRVVMGQGETAWIGGAEQNVVFVGGEEAVDTRTPMELVDTRHTLKFRMAIGVAAGLASAPGAFSQYLTVERAEQADRAPALRVTVHHKSARGQGVIELADDGRTPRRIALGEDGALGQIVVRQWLVNTVAPDALFDPPDDMERKSVRQEDVCRMIAALFDFAMESIQ